MLYNIWIKLKRRVWQSNSEAESQTYHVCQYRQSFLNKNRIPCRCIPNGLITEHVPKELQILHPLSKQTAHTVWKSLSGYIPTGHLPKQAKFPITMPSRAYKATIFFLPLPLEKTLQTIDEVQSNKSGEGLAGLPNPELYIIVNGKPSKNKNLWQSVVNVEHVKAAVEKSREINWLLYAVC